MRIDLSKVTFISTCEDFTICELGNVTAITSNRQQTLLFQSTRKISGSSTSSISEISPQVSQMSKLTFLNVFDNHKPEDIEKLDRLFLECKGNLPSRRQLSAIAQSIGIQQSKIKKWFEKRSMDQKPASPYNDEESDGFWDELNAKLDQIDAEISSIESKIQ